MILSRNTVNLRSETYGDVSERTVIGVGNSGEENSSLVDTELVALMEMVVDYRAKEIVCRGDRVEVAREMEIDVVHRHYLRVSAACRAAFDTENRSERGLSERDYRVFADLVHRHTETYGGSCLSFTCGCGVDGGHENELAVWLVLCSCEELIVYLCLIFAVELKLVIGDIKLGCNFLYGKHFSFGCDLNICFHFKYLFVFDFSGKESETDF